MSERKGINKYYPPDWDPSKVVKKKKPSNQIIKVRLNTPFSMRCLKCNEYISSLRKFNARKETLSEKYLNVRIIRFHIVCPRCNNNITFKTNPQTADYVTESGAVRNYEPKQKVADVPKDRLETEDEILRRLEKEDQENKSYQDLKEKRKKNPFWKKSESLRDQEGDLMENLEKRLQEQQRQQQLNDQLELLQSRSAQLQTQGGSDQVLNEARINIEKEISQLESQRNKLIDQEDSKEAKKAFEDFESFPDITKEPKSSSLPPSKKRALSDSKHQESSDQQKIAEYSEKPKNSLSKIKLKKKPQISIINTSNVSNKDQKSISNTALKNGIGNLLGEYSTDED